MKNKDEYGTEITIDELKAHYRAHVITAEQYIDLVISWHESDVEELNIPDVSNAKRTICHCTEPQFKENIQGDLLCQNCGKP